jgi:DNA repair protein RadD
MQLRDYQQEAVNALDAYIRAEKGNPIISIPTGGGKSVVIAAAIKKLFEHNKGYRFLVLSHSKEIIEQNAWAIAEHALSAPAVYGASLGSKDVGDITTAQIQSAYNKAYEFGVIDFVFIDECHRVSNDEDSMYRKLLRELTITNRAIRVVGFSATPFRMRCGLLTDQNDSIFTDIIYEVPVLKLIKEGYLSPLISKSSAIQADLSGVKKIAGDFNQGMVERVMDVPDFITKTADDLIKQGEGRKSWLVFCSGIGHAFNVTHALKSRGIKAEYVYMATPQERRAELLEDFKKGRIRALVNADVLTTGFDAPNVDLVALLRATLSPGLYIQMVGRGLRKAEGKENCKILDYAGNIERFGPIDQVEIPRPPGDKRENVVIPEKMCPECASIIHASVMTCKCGYEFPRKNPHDIIASTRAILSEQEDDFRLVSDILYTRHRKEGKPDSVRVTYICGDKQFSEWVCPEHQGINKRAFKWIEERSSLRTAIELSSVNEILKRSDELLKPSAIKVKKDGQYYRVTDYEF